MIRLWQQRGPTGRSLALALGAASLLATAASADIPRWGSVAQRQSYAAKWQGLSESDLAAREQGFGVSNLPDSPLVGKYRGVCLLVRFRPHADNDLNHTISFYNNLYNSPTNTESFHNYWLEQSYGQFDISVDTYGWFTLPPKASMDFTMTGDPTDDMVAAAIQAADPTVDFSQYDADHNGIIDFLLLVHATPDGLAPLTAPWQYGGPFAFSYSLANGIAPQAVSSLATSDGVAANSFIQWDESVSTRIGIFSHEFGHAMGLPDLYDTSWTQTMNFGPTGIWSVMGRGIHTEDASAPPGLRAFNVLGQGFPGVPMHLDVWCKTLLGWVTPIEVSPGQSLVTLSSIENNAVAYRLHANADPNADEYFLIERRSQTGFDLPLPGQGLIIWHVDSKVVRERYALNEIEESLTRLGLAVVQADGLHDLEMATGNALATPTVPAAFTAGNLGDAGDLWPGTSGNTRFVPSTDLLPSTVTNSPTSDTYDGTNSGVSVTGISNATGGTSATLALDVTFSPTVRIISPTANQQMVNFTPTIEVQFTETHPSPPGFDLNNLVLVVDGLEVVSAALGNVASSFSTATGTLTYTTVALVSGVHTVRASGRDLKGTIAVGHDLTGNVANYDEVRFTVAPKTVRMGKRMMTVPFNLTHSTPSFVLSNPAPQFARYDARTLTYHVFTESPTDPFVNRFIPGRSYWVNLTSDVALQLRGSGVPRLRQELTFETPNGDGTLLAGWYMIGSPFDFTIDFNSLQVQHQGVNLSLADAITQGIVGPALYSYLNGGYVYEVAPNGQLEEFGGYWIRVLKSGTRLFALPLPSGRSAAVRATPQVGDGWLVQLSAASQSGADRLNCFGVSAAASKSRLDVEEPPPAVGEEGGVALSFVRREAGAGNARLAQEVRQGPLTRTETWEALVEGRSGEEVALSWGDLAAVPRSVRLTLVDPVTNRTVYMRTSCSYTCSLGSAGANRLRIVAEPNASSFLRVTGVRVQPTRGGGIDIAFQVTDPATSQVTIRSISGRTLRTLPAVAHRAGLVTRQWDGRDAGGRVAPKGVYLCEIVARNDAEQATRAIQPFSLAR